MELPFCPKELKLRVNKQFLDLPQRPECLYSTKVDDVIDGWIGTKSGAAFYREGVLQYEVNDRSKVEVVYKPDHEYHRLIDKDNDIFLAFQNCMYKHKNTKTQEVMHLCERSLRLFCHNKRFQCVEYSDTTKKLVFWNGKLKEQQDKVTVATKTC